MVTKELRQKTLNLKPIDKIRLVEIILDSLNKPDKEIEKAWIKESEERYSAYKKDQIKALGYDTVQKKFNR